MENRDGVFKQIFIGVLIAVVSAFIIWKLGFNQTENLKINQNSTIKHSNNTDEQRSNYENKQETIPVVAEQNYQISPTNERITDEETGELFKIVGLWETNVKEFNMQIQIKVNLESNGIATYNVLTSNGVNTFNSSWKYSNGYLIEQFPDGGYGKGKVTWIDGNTFELTIVDNGVPAYSGIKRIYVRL
ncbi:MAG: hypothetical protein ACK5UE_09650 [Chitinophagales bacterium]|jgi:hypothetical protein|nr:hypothetical protein [Sphingobacteriales bacterium]